MIYRVTVQSRGRMLHPGCLRIYVYGVTQIRCSKMDMMLHVLCLTLRLLTDAKKIQLAN